MSPPHVTRLASPTPFSGWRVSTRKHAEHPAVPPGGAALCAPRRVTDGVAMGDGEGVYPRAIVPPGVLSAMRVGSSLFSSSPQRKPKAPRHAKKISTPERAGEAAHGKW